MVSREEFAAVLDSFMSEMSVIVVRDGPSRLRLLPGLAKELREARSMLSDPSVPLEQVLALSFGAVDEYYGANRNDIIDQAYALYSDQVQASKEADR